MGFLGPARQAAGEEGVGGFLRGLKRASYGVIASSPVFPDRLLVAKVTGLIRLVRTRGAGTRVRSARRSTPFTRGIPERW